jgi:hypothetical protein
MKIGNWKMRITKVIMQNRTLFLFIGLALGGVVGAQKIMHPPPLEAQSIIAVMNASFLAAALFFLLLYWVGVTLVKKG